MSTNRERKRETGNSYYSWLMYETYFIWYMVYILSIYTTASGITVHKELIQRKIGISFKLIELIKYKEKLDETYGIETQYIDSQQL